MTWIEHFEPAVESVYRSFEPLLGAEAAGEQAARITRYEEQGVPRVIARRVVAGVRCTPRSTWRRWRAPRGA